MFRQDGFSLVEIVIVIAIISVLMGIALPSFQVMIANTKTKSAAESVLSGLRSARAEAIRRNAPMRFQLVTTLSTSGTPASDPGCALSANGPNWIVTQTNQNLGQDPAFPTGTTYSYGIPTEHCGDAPAIPPNACTSMVCADQPYIALKSPNQPGVGISVVANGSAVTFSPLGWVLPNIEATPSINQINVSSTVNGAKAWRVTIRQPGGSLKLCDPALSAGAAMGCT